MPPSDTRSAAASVASRRETGTIARILFADDEPDLRAISSRVLAKVGYQVDTVEDGESAWVALCAKAYDLLITDNQMPRLTGLELIRKLRLSRMNVPIILSSASFGALSIDELMRLGCRAMLAKPFTPEQLTAMVREVLRAATSERMPAGISVPALERVKFRVEPRRKWGINGKPHPD